MDAEFDQVAERRQRATFEAVRRRVFEEMRVVSSRWRLALILPFHLLVLAVLAARGEPGSRLALQAGAFAVCLVAMTVAERACPRKGWPALGVGGVSILVAVANTGGLASPLLVSTVPFLMGLSMNPNLERKRALVFGMFLAAFTTMAVVSRSALGELSGPLAPNMRWASAEYVTLALASVSLTLLVMYQMGRSVTVAYERIALELADRRAEICDETEGRTRALEGIAARLAHEVKNPLAAIKGLSTHVARSADDPKVKERLSIVAAEAERLQEIVEGFLSFSRGLDELKVAPTKPYDVGRELSLLLETRAADAGVSIDVRGSGELTLNADAKKLRQALLNLVLNAMHASARDSEVTIEVAKSCADGAAVIRVVDHGEGMTPEILDRIRKPYFTTKEGGSGLGIAVARGIIEQHGGSLRFESTPGRGTTATVVLPACADAATAQRCLQKLPNPCRDAREGALGDARKHAPHPHPLSEPAKVDGT